MCLVFQRFREVKHISVHPGGKCADIVVFADVYGVKRAITCMCRATPPRTRGEDHHASVTHEPRERGQ